MKLIINRFIICGLLGSSSAFTPKGLRGDLHTSRRLDRDSTISTYRGSGTKTRETKNCPKRNGRRLSSKSEKSEKSEKTDNNAQSKLMPQKKRLDGATIEKFVDNLVIPPVLYDDEAGEYHYDDNGKSFFHVGLRQIQQQVLPDGYNATTQWAYGDPDRPETFNNPAFTIEVTKDKATDVVWINELVEDPDECRKKGDHDACRYLPHIVQDKNGVPIVDQNLHWANPPQMCKDGDTRPDCKGNSADPYDGPVPMVIHVHGGHTEAQSDGYPEAWYLPDASNIPQGYATHGTFYRSRELPSDDSLLQCSDDEDSNKGYAVFRYQNDQPTTTLWYHDHSLGITRLNVYAAAAGFWLIRNEHDDGETFLSEFNCDGKRQKLPGPAPKLGEDPNNNPWVRKSIREIPIAIQPRAFYDDGSLWYPADRLYFDSDGECSDGDVFGLNDLGGDNVPYEPEAGADISPVWNPEAFFDMMVVNGKTWPKYEVAPERYRLRLLNAADSRFMNLALKVNYDANNPEDVYEELPFYIIGSDQGLLPNVVKVQTCHQTVLHPCSSSGLFEGDEDRTEKREHEGSEEHECTRGAQALLMAPAERYDVIVDFQGLHHGDTVTMINTGPDSPFSGVFPVPEEDIADPLTTGLIMRFDVDYSLRNCRGFENPPKCFDHSTPPDELKLEKCEDLGSIVETRDLALLEEESETCGTLNTDMDQCTWMKEECNDDNSYGPIAAVLGTEGSQGGVVQKWIDPISQNPQLGDTEEWELWNWSADAHPIHLHLVGFQVVNRQKLSEALRGIKCTDVDCFEGDPIDPQPFELCRKDTVVAPAGFVTRIKANFDLKGLYVWHCHILSHEDQEMMVPYCVGDIDKDCFGL